MIRKTFKNYIFWVILVALIGVFLAWGAWTGVKIAYAKISPELTKIDFKFLPAFSLFASPREIVYQATTSSTNTPAVILPRKLNLENFDSANPQVPKVGKVIVADLKKMSIFLYRDGEMVASSTILGKGRPGTPWETPAGEYKIKLKKPSHFSSIGKVTMPYSMQFFGNYFIHGWPRYSNGKPVPKGYSGGCIRLSDLDAKKVYDFADTETMVMIYGADRDLVSASSQLANSAYILLKDPDRIPLSADAYLVADIDTGEIILEKNKSLVTPIASVTKLVTALVSLETLNQYQTITVSKEAARTYSKSGSLLSGEKFKTGDLIYPLLLQSSNDAAEVLAEAGGRKNFISQMNEKVKSVGLDQTYFEDPSGLSENNVSSAEDLFKLARYIYQYKKYIFDITKEKEAKVGRYKFANINRLHLLNNYVGGKDGYTDEAGRTLVAVFTMPLSEFEQRNIALILLKSENRTRDTAELIKYIVTNVSRQTPSSFTPGA